MTPASVPCETAVEGGGRGKTRRGYSAPVSDSADQPGLPTVAAVVVHYRNADATLRCLDCVDRQRPHPPAGILVRNAYPDTQGTWDRIAHAAADRGWTVLDAGRNTGFAAGSNLGMAHAQRVAATYLWLVNPDTHARPDALAALVAAMDANPRLGAAGSHLGGGPPGGQVRLWRGRAREGNTGPWHFISGASMLLRTAAIAEVGGFDESLFLYWEDVELCHRLRTAGYGLAVVPESRVTHEGGGAVGQASAVQDYFASRNGLLVVRKHAPAWLPTAAVATLLRVSLAKLLRGEWHRLRPACRGWWDGCRGRGGPPPTDLIAPGE